MQQQSSKLLAIVGETASGKSALGLELAQRFQGEIIAADSWTVRRGLDIATAKPSAEERAAVPHHLLDIVEPCADFNAAMFKSLAEGTISEIAHRGKLPIMVGGTGLYVDSVVFNYSFMPAGDVAQRQALNSLSISQLLEKIDTQGLDLNGIDIRNKRRLIRLIETGGQRPGRGGLRQHSLILGLKIDRQLLRARIEARVEAMFKNGLKYEVKDLAEKYGWQCEGLKGIGYREFQGYFAGDYSLQATKRKIIRSTLELAKRQRTWFKRNRDITWIDNPSQAFELVEDFLKA